MDIMLGYMELYVTSLNIIYGMINKFYPLFDAT